MNLQKHKTEFEELVNVVSRHRGLSEGAVYRDYYIVYMLEQLANSIYAEQVVFKGGTSLSKCYPGSIERFSEDIDLTYLGMEQTDKECEKAIKGIIAVMTVGANTAKIPGEGSARSKSRKVWFDKEERSVKLEIGSSVRPDPYEKKTIKTYIQEYLEEKGMEDIVKEFGLEEVTLNTLCIERTFIDKVMSVKRHAICGSLDKKVRHIYDVVRLFQMEEIKAFVADKDELKRLVRLTKETDSFYLEKRNINKEYNPLSAYDFSSWEHYLGDNVKERYETLHEDLLYTKEKQDFARAIATFKEISRLLANIQE